MKSSLSRCAQQTNFDKLAENLNCLNYFLRAGFDLHMSCRRPPSEASSDCEAGQPLLQDNAPRSERRRWLLHAKNEFCILASSFLLSFQLFRRGCASSLHGYKLTGFNFWTLAATSRVHRRYDVSTAPGKSSACVEFSWRRYHALQEKVSLGITSDDTRPLGLPCKLAYILHLVWNIES